MNYKNWLLGIIPSEEIAIKVCRRTGTILIIYAFIIAAAINLHLQDQPKVYYDLLIMSLVLIFFISAILVRVKKKFIAAIICSLIIVLTTINNASNVGQGAAPFAQILLSIFMLFICYSSLMATSFLRK